MTDGDALGRTLLQRSIRVGVLNLPVVIIRILFSYREK